MSIMKKALVTTMMILMVVAFMPAMEQSYAAAKKPGKATIKVKTKKNKATITYKAKGAKKFKVYRYKGGKWKAIKTGKKKTIVKLTKAGTYKFKVRGIKGKKKGKFSKVAKVKVKVKKVKVNGKTVNKVTASVSYTKAKAAPKASKKVRKLLKREHFGDNKHSVDKQAVKLVTRYYAQKRGLSEEDTDYCIKLALNVLVN